MLYFHQWNGSKLIKRIEQLPPDRLAEVERFVESIVNNDRRVDQDTLHQALAEYAARCGGTAADLDEDLDRG